MNQKYFVLIHCDDFTNERPPKNTVQFDQKSVFSLRNVSFDVIIGDHWNKCRICLKMLKSP